MRFVNVTADQCNSQGIPGRQGDIRVEFHLNVDLIGGVRGRDVWPKVGKILNVNGDFFINIRLAEGVNIDEI